MIQVISPPQLVMPESNCISSKRCLLLATHWWVAIKNHKHLFALAATQHVHSNGGATINFFECPATNEKIGSSLRKAEFSTTGMHIIFGGLKIEPDVEVGQIGLLRTDTF
jgi:hypothetical protein